ncbi:hypothetical protein JCM8097_008604 [Rhodosporidiobolus ruineniae]
MLLLPLLALLLPLALADQLVFSRQPWLLPSDFDSFGDSLVREWGVPGVAVGVVKVGDGGKTTTDFHSFGSAGKGRKVDEDTLFGIASNSKAFTAAAVGQLVHQGRISWTDKVHDLLPDFQLQDHHEASYRSGETTAELLERLRYLRPSAELRETWHLMFGTAAHLVSNLTSRSFTSHVASTIFHPLNMTSTSYAPHPSPDLVSRLSASYLTLENGTAVEIPYGFNFSREDLEFNAGAGGVVSSTRDMVKWVELLIRQRQASRKGNTPSPLDSVLAPATIRALSTPRSIVQPEPSYPFLSPTLYGMGLMLTSYNGSEYIYHGGSIPGFGSQVAWSSDLGVGVVVLCNTDGTGNAVSDILAYRAFDNLLNRPALDWNKHYHTLATADRNASHAALQHAHEHKEAKVPPSLPEEAYLGRYADAGYGSVTLCAYPPPPSSSLLSPPAERAAPESCAALYARLALSTPFHSPQPPDFPSPVFLLSQPGFFGMSHVLLRHFNGSEWRDARGSVFDGTKTGEGGKWVRYAEADEVRVRFVSEGEGVRGMEMSGVWGAGAGVEEEEGRIEVVFERV